MPTREAGAPAGAERSEPRAVAAAPRAPREPGAPEDAPPAGAAPTDAARGGAGHAGAEHAGAEHASGAPTTAGASAGDDGRDVARLRLGPLALLARAAGSPREMAEKLGRLAASLRALASKPRLEARLERLRALGYVTETPTRLQLVVGSIDMLRFWISPAADEYYRSRGITFGFHQILRVLEEPASMVDPTGFLLERGVIIDHLLQVTHANPAYDLQLLEAHDGGLEALVDEVRQAIAGTHPKSRSLAATVEDAGYHARLLSYAEDYLRDRTAPPPIRANVAGSSRWAKIEATFGTLPAAMRYFARMPKAPGAAARHLLTVRAFPEHLGELAATR